jgi:drug/metabolite transporter (DMT)-like permease
MTPLKLSSLLLGTLAGILNALGIVALNLAYTLGPMGPVAALVALTSVFLTIIQSIQLHRLPHWMEVLGMLLGLTGALIITIGSRLTRKCRRRQRARDIEMIRKSN